MAPTKRQLRGTVRNILSQHDTPHLETPEFEYLFDSSKAIPFRVFWSITITLCLSVCCIQITDRIQWYLSYPIAVDIRVDTLKSVEVFEIQFASPETDYLFEIPPIEGRDLYHKNTEHQIYPFVELLSQNNVSIDFDKLWNFENQSRVIESVEVDKTTNKSLMYRSSPSVVGATISVELGAHVKSPIRIYVETKSRRLRYGVAILNPQNDFRRGLWYMLKKCFFWNVAFIKFTRIRTPLYHCVGIKEFALCYDQCITRILKAKAICKLPPYDSLNTNLPPCKTVELAYHSYFVSLELFLKPDFYGICGCKEQCHSTRFVLTIFNDQECPAGVTRMTINSDEYEISFNERVSYDGISLLTDIGGNLGLFLGLTLLSILYNIQQLMIFWKKQWLNIKAVKRSAMYEMIDKHCRQCKVEKSLLKINNKKYSLITIFKAVIWLICACFALFMIQDRIGLYFQHPVRLIVKLEKQENITLPSLTICAVSDETFFRKKKYAKKNNITNWFDVHLLDLVNFDDQESLMQVWLASLLEPVLQYNLFLEEISKVQSPKPNVTFLMTPEGYCMHHKFFGDKYEGFLSLHLIVFFVMKAREMNTPFFIFTDEPGSNSFNILTKREIVYHLVTFYEFSVQKYIRLNINNRPCVKKEIYDQCKHQCLTSRIQEENLCWLPYFPPDINATMCKSAKEAKDSHKKYTKTLIKTAKGQVCNCYSRICSETILTQVISTQRSPYINVYEAWFGVSDNTLENIIEVELYSLVALFCDVGNNLGVALGMSFLTIVNFSRQAFFASSSYLKFTKLF